MTACLRTSAASASRGTPARRWRARAEPAPEPADLLRDALGQRAMRAEPKLRAAELRIAHQLHARARGLSRYFEHRNGGGPSQPVDELRELARLRAETGRDVVDALRFALERGEGGSGDICDVDVVVLVQTIATDAWHLPGECGANEVRDRARHELSGPVDRRIAEDRAARPRRRALELDRLLARDLGDRIRRPR